VKFGIAVPGMSLYPGGVEHWWKDITMADFQAIARRADELGYEYLLIPEHIIMNKEREGTMAARWVHSLSAAGFLLGATTRIKVVCLLVVPLHNAIELAKSLSTLDYMSDGRIVPMIMVGEQEWEFELLGSPPFAERGQVTEEYLEAMIELWTAGEPRYDGKYVSFDDVVFDPKPVQRPMTLWFGARTKVALRRAARFGDGWMNTRVPRARIREMIEHVKAQPEFQARRRPFDVTATMWEYRGNPTTHEIFEKPKIDASKDGILEQLHQLAALGVTATGADMAIGGRMYDEEQTGAPPVRGATDYLERLQWFAEEVIPEGSQVEPAEIG
jgi:probable F420-dependent oxidoreductase